MLQKISLPSQPTSLCYQKENLYVGMIDGSLGYITPNSTNYNDSVFFEEDLSIRSIAPQNDQMICGLSNELSLVDLVKEQVIRKYADDSVTKVLSLTEHLFCSGSDDGTVKLWDIRNDKLISEYKENEDFISDIVYVEEKRSLLVAGGDGYFSVLDPRKKDCVARSDNLEIGILSIAVVKNIRKVVVGLEAGVLGIFTWGDWGDVSDRIKGHPGSVDCLVKLNEDDILTGCSDGIVRQIGILPNKFKGIVKEFKEGAEEDSCGVEQMVLSTDGQYLATCAHSDSLFVLDLLQQESEEVNDNKRTEDSFDSDREEEKRPKTKKKKSKQKPFIETKKDSFFNDL